MSGQPDDTQTELLARTQAIQLTLARMEEREIARDQRESVAVRRMDALEVRVAQLQQHRDEQIGRTNAALGVGFGGAGAGVAALVHALWTIIGHGGQ